MNEIFPQEKMRFLVGDSCSMGATDDGNRFYLADDKSLLYSARVSGDYSVLLGGNWRFELIVDSATGLCVYFQSFLAELHALHRPIDLPESRHKRLFFEKSNLMYPGEGCHYLNIKNKVYWDERTKILCVGTPNTPGEAVEFTPQTIAVIKNDQLCCLYLVLSNVTGIEFL